LLHGKGKKTKQSSTLQQYILSYSKNISKDEWVDYKLTTGTFQNPDNDKRGKWFSGSVSFDEARSNREHKNYFEIVSPSGKKWTRQWQCNKEEMDELLKENKIYFGKSPAYNNVPRLKIFPFDKDKIIPSNMLDSCGTTQSAQGDLDMIISNEDGKSVFENPKSVELIKHILSIVNMHDNVTVLDFMAGSGTTGHAVLELNKEDGGNRQFILCTNNENNNGNGLGGIARTVCQPRIERVMNGYKKNGDGDFVEGLGGELEYFETDFIDVENIYNMTDEKKLEFSHRAGYLISLKENAFKEIKKTDWYQIFTNEKEDKMVGIYFKENIEKLEELEQKIIQDDKEVKLYIFSHSGENDWESDYEEYDNVTVEDIPTPILKVYQALNR